MGCCDKKILGWGSLWLSLVWFVLWETQVLLASTLNYTFFSFVVIFFLMSGTDIIHHSAQFFLVLFYNRVVHSSHFRSIFSSFSASFLDHFHCLAEKWYKMKPKMKLKMVTVNAPNHKETKQWTLEEFRLCFRCPNIETYILSRLSFLTGSSAVFSRNVEF